MNDEAISHAPDDHGRLRLAWDALRVYFGLGLLGVMGLLWSLLAAPLYYVLPRKTGLVVGRWLIHTAFRFYLRTLAAIGACRFDLSALDALQGQAPMIVAPNHPSLIDAVLVISRLPGLACIMKAEILDNPSLGAGARLARYIRNDALRNMIHLAVADLRAGHHLLLFPEGTRSTSRPIGPVRGSVGLIAKQAQVPVQTVLSKPTRPFSARAGRCCNGRCCPSLIVCGWASVSRRRKTCKLSSPRSRPISRAHWSMPCCPSHCHRAMAPVPATTAAARMMDADD